MLNSEEDDHLARASQDKYYEPQSEDEGSEQEGIEQQGAEEAEETAEGAGKDSNPRKRVGKEGSEAEGTAEGDKRSSQKY